eukprot:TRINITY_DN6674_c0_g3_i2.p1 TRINITY_DN6674_c0_g3~~TRINITY_DN6674_c0_g3_i2.p1  ORF type:complete len:142 (-),score=18.85 TRINITY_DN6674_c0_g3_i2:40-465(-)
MYKFLESIKESFANGECKVASRGVDRETVGRLPQTEMKQVKSYKTPNKRPLKKQKEGFQASSEADVELSILQGMPINCDNYYTFAVSSVPVSSLQELHNETAIKELTKRANRDRTPVKKGFPSEKSPVSYTHLTLPTTPYV